MNFKQLLSFIKRFRYEIVAVIFTAYGMYLRIAWFAIRGFGTDDLCSFQFMQGPFKPFWQRIQYTDFTYFPGEYIINWPFVFFFKANKWGFGIPHILATLLGFYLLYLICKRYFHSIFAWIATFALVAVHRELIFHSFELRPYAVLPTLALAAFYFIEQIVSSRYRLSLTRKILIGALFIFTIIYHVYGGFILFFTFIYFLLRESAERNLKELFRHNCNFIGAIIIIGLPLFLWYSTGPYVAHRMSYDIFEYIPNPMVYFFRFIKVVLCCITGNKILYPLVVSLIFPFLLPYRSRLQQIGFLLVLIILPVMAIFHIDLSVGYWFLQRQFIWVMPLFAFLIGWCLDSFVEFIKNRDNLISNK